MRARERERERAREREERHTHTNRKRDFSLCQPNTRFYLLGLYPGDAWYPAVAADRAGDIALYLSIERGGKAVGSRQGTFFS